MSDNGVNSVNVTVKPNQCNHIALNSHALNTITLINNTVTAIDFEDVLFNHNSAVFLPNGPNEATTNPVQDKVAGLRVIQTVYYYTSENKEKK